MGQEDEKGVKHPPIGRPKGMLPQNSAIAVLRPLWTRRQKEKNLNTANAAEK